MKTNEVFYYAHVLDNSLKQLKLIPISDPHYGNPFFSKPHFLKTIREIEADPEAYTILNGDLCEASIRTSKGEIYRQVGSPQDQRDWMIEKLYPIRHKILGVDRGNHELRIYNEVGIDICKDIAKALGAPYRAESIPIKVSFGGGNSGHNEKPYSYFIYATHGHGGARTKSAKAVKLERTAHQLHADVYLMSHDHVVNAAPDVYLLPDSRTHYDEELGFNIGVFNEKRKILVKTNAYLKWGGYSETDGYPPVDLETPIVFLAGEGKPKVRALV